MQKTLNHYLKKKIKLTTLNIFLYDNKINKLKDK